MTPSTSYIAVKSISLSRVGGRKPCTLLTAARHNLREIQAEHGTTGRIDPTLTRHNTILAGPGNSADVQAQANMLLATLGPLKLRRDHCQAIEVVFSLPVEVSGVDPTAYFLQCLRWLRKAFQLPVLSAVRHHDEAAPHMHVLLLPVKNGEHVGSAPIGTPKLKGLREAFFANVAGPAGFKRENAKFVGATKQWAVDAVLRRCEAMGLREANGPMWEVLVNAIKRDPMGSMLALGIDVNSIRPIEEPASTESLVSPIGLAQKPIGIQKPVPPHRTLSCVEFAHPSEPNEAPKPHETQREPRAAPGGVKKSPIVRLDANEAARQVATEPRPLVQSPQPRPMLCAQWDADRLTRVRDEYSDDLAAWRDYG